MGKTDYKTSIVTAQENEKSQKETFKKYKNYKNK